jgi:hypothetical protein
MSAYRILGLEKSGSGPIRSRLAVPPTRLAASVYHQAELLIDEIVDAIETVVDTC